MGIESIERQGSRYPAVPIQDPTGVEVAVKVEFSRPVRVAELGPEGRQLVLEASDSERAALAKRFALLSIDRLEAEVRVLPVLPVLPSAASPVSGDIAPLYRLDAEMRAEVAQRCVVSGQPVPARFAEAFTLHYSESAVPLDPNDDLSLDEMTAGADDFSDDPEPLENGRIDVGEAVAQQLSLSLDPYPRAGDISLASLSGLGPDPEPAAGSAARNGGESREQSGPFAILAGLRDK